MGIVSWTQGEGSLALFADGFRRELLGLGYSASSTKHHLVVMGQLNRWLSTEQCGISELNAVVAQQFLNSRRANGQRRVPTMVTLAPLFKYLRTQRAIVPEAPTALAARDELLVRYGQHLVQGRGLAPTTVRRYETFAKRFLAGRALRTGTETGAENLSSTEVNSFMLEAGSRLVVESAKRESADLRALLRFLYLDGQIGTDLGSAMAPVATWRGGRLPSAMSAVDVDKLLASCDRSTATGLRDHAIMVLLARLGLRSGEVAALELDDIDWRAGEIAVRGKARRRDRLPLLVEVGESLVDYLRGARPMCEYPQLILTLYAPPRPICPGSITGVVYRACRRAAVARVGGHQLRHALATEMLRQGGDLLEIAQVLRHSDLATTSGYAKVDRIALRRVAQAWPGAAR